MSKAIITAILLLLPLAALTCHAAGDKASALQAPLSSAGKGAVSYPQIVLYSTSWCPHCRQVKEYFKEQQIPYLNRDVEADQQALKDLFAIAAKQGTPPEKVGVPVIVIGNDEKVINGFTPEQFQAALQELRQKPK
jgi:glutaredoxin 3